MKVKINCSLVYGEHEKVFPGHVFEGKFEELHKDIQALVKKGCLFIEVTKDDPKPIKKEIVKVEPVKKELVKVEPKKVAKPKTKKLIKKTKK